ncbi:condensation domain-containing protein [Paenibacillus sp. FSL L8-0470]|uniref:condensation domain-containing protein n=1 Tax=Paenibacillus sp. FSL L8-0470 TaxID=2954688 RepID=UPI0030F71C62
MVGGPMARYADSEEQLREIAYWKRVEEMPAAALPADEDLEAEETGGAVSIRLSQEETAQLLNQANRAYYTEINDILLTGLGLALREWTGKDRFVVDLGRAWPGRDRGSGGCEPNGGVVYDDRADTA